MKAIILTLALTFSPACAISADDFKGKMKAHVAAMKAQHHKLKDMPRTEVGGERSIASYIYNAAKSAAGRVRSMYSLRSDADDYADDMMKTDSDVCKYVHNTGCYEDSNDDQFMTAFGFTIGSCSECAYALDSSDLTEDPLSCYTCPSGYSLQTMSASYYDDDFMSPMYEQVFSCTGACILEDQVTEFQAFAQVYFNFTTFTDIDAAECKPYGTKYPLDCFPSDDSDAVCFSGTDTVQLESGETKMLSEVQVGDRVLSADAQGVLSYSDVVFLPHAANNKVATFVSISTEGGKALQATKTHLVKTCAGDLAYAGALKAGDCLRTVDGEERVASTSVNKAEGIYSVVAENEFVVVGGIVASPFAFAHGATNAVYNIHRALYKVAPALLKSSAVVSANAVLGSAAVLAANLFTQSK